MGGIPPLGYTNRDRQLVICEEEAATVRLLFDHCRSSKSVSATVHAAKRLGLRSRPLEGQQEGRLLSDGRISYLLVNPTYIGSIRHKRAIHAGQHPPIITPDLWTEVQAILDKGRPNLPVRNGQPRSKLLGRLIDEEGQTLISKFSNSRWARRRYYVSRTPSTGGSQSTRWRIAAEKFELTVSTAVANHLRRISVAYHTDPQSEVHDNWSGVQEIKNQRTSSEYRILDLVDRVGVAPGILTITLSPPKVASRLGVKPVDLAPADLQATSAFQQRRRAWEGRYVIGDTITPVDQPLLRYVAKGVLWWRAIQNGKAIAEIAATEGVSPRFVSLHIPAAFLAPDILALIADGRQPASLTIKTLRDTDLPSDWDEQRALFGIKQIGTYARKPNG